LTKTTKVSQKLERAYAVVMAGGQGTRLWPLSRKARPKQFLKLAGDGRSLIQAAVARALRVVGTVERVLVVAPVEQAEMVRADLPDLPPANLILEPLGRNTAAAIGLAALAIQQRDPSAVMGVFPADHLFRDEKPWNRAVCTALEFAAGSEQLVTIGLQPNSPSPSYGYLYLGEILPTPGQLQIFKVHQFVEKPSVTLAQTYLDSGRYLWNTGTFAWKVETILQSFQTHLPHHFAGFQKIGSQPDSWDTISTIYPTLENISIDYGVLERSANVTVVKANFERIDLGNLANLSELAKLSEGSDWSGDADGNAWRGNGVIVDGENTAVYDETDAGMTIAFGLDHVIVVRQDDVVIALPKKDAHRIKDLLNEIKARGGEQYL
jgi:mannose-1-phosphate guanylyltransferase